MSIDTPESHSLPRPRLDHNRLEPFAGTFRTVVRLFLGPGPVHETTGTMVNSWQVQGLFLHQAYDGDPNADGSPSFVGRGYLGYNQSAKRYEGFWIDIASTMMQFEAGNVDSTGKIWTLIGEFPHPVSGDKLVRKNVITIVDHDHHRMDSYITGPDGIERKTMEIEYTRA